MSRTKYRNTRVMVDGIAFDSMAEARRWQELQLLEHAGEIASLRRQVRLDLHGRDGPVVYPNNRIAHVVVDFAYIERGQQVYEDKKGQQTPKSKLQHAVLVAQGIAIRIV